MYLRLFKLLDMEFLKEKIEDKKKNGQKLAFMTIFMFHPYEFILVRFEF